MSCYPNSLAHDAEPHPEVSGPQGHLAGPAGLRLVLLEMGLWSAHSVNRLHPLKYKAGPNPGP